MTVVATRPSARNRFPNRSRSLFLDVKLHQRAPYRGKAQRRPRRRLLRRRALDFGRPPSTPRLPLLPNEPSAPEPIASIPSSTGVSAAEIIATARPRSVITTRSPA